MPRQKGVPLLRAPREKVPYSRSDLEEAVRIHKQNYGVCPGSSDGKVTIAGYKTDWARIITTDIPDGHIEGIERGISYTKFLDTLGFVPANREKHLQRAKEKENSAYAYTLEQIKTAINDYFAENNLWPSKMLNSKILVEGQPLRMQTLESMLLEGKIKYAKTIRNVERLLKVLSAEQAQAHKSKGRKKEFAVVDMTIDEAKVLIRNFLEAGGTPDDLRSWHTPLNDKVKVGNLVAAFKAECVIGAELGDRLFHVVEDMMEPAGQDAQVVALANEG